jgi:hypothetical protein
MDSGKRATVSADVRTKAGKRRRYLRLTAEGSCLAR